MNHGARWRRFAPLLVGAGALLCLLAAWAFAPVKSATAGETLEVVLVDASDSCRRTRPGWARNVERRLVERAARAREQGHSFAVFAFGADVVRWFGPARAEEFRFDPAWATTQMRTDATRTAEAVEAARRLAAQVQARAQVLLIGDDARSDEEDWQALARLEAEGGAFEFELVSPAELCDVALGEVRRPRELEAGAPLSLRIEYDVGEPRPAKLEAHALVVDARGERSLTFPLSTSAVAERLDFGPAAAGTTRITVTLAAAGDPIPENDSATVLVRTVRDLAVSLVATPQRRSAAEALARGWSALGLSVTLEADAAGLPRLQDTDVLVSLDLPPSSFDVERMEPFLRNGGGWICCGTAVLGNELVSAPRSTAAQWLPLELDDGDEERDVLLVVDVSGSMSGPEFDRVRNAAIQLGGAARPLDRVILRLFTDQLSRPYDLGFGGDRTRDDERARILMRLRPPGGPTDLVRTLEELVDEREASERKALLFLLTDGRDESRHSGAAERARIAIERLGAARTRTVTLVSGADPNFEFLRNLDAPESAAELVQADGELAPLLESELAEDWVLPGPRALFDDSQGAAPAAEIAAALDFAALELGPCVAMKLREGDLALARERDGRSVIALRSMGEGWTATLAISPGDAGSPSFVHAPQAWAPLVRAVGRGRAPSDEQPRLEWADVRTLQLSLAPGSRWRPKEFSRPRVEWVPGDGSEVFELSAEPANRPQGPGGTQWLVEWRDHEEMNVLGRGFLRVGLKDRVVAVDLPRWVPEEFRRSLGPSITAFERARAAEREGRWQPREPRLGTWFLLLGLGLLSAGALLGGARGARRVA